MWRRFLVLAAVAIPAVALAGAGHAAWRMHERPTSEAELRERIGLVEGKVLDRIDASDAQREQVGERLDGLAADLWDRHDDREARHAELVKLLTAEKIDRKALEDVRSDIVKQFDDASSEVFDAIGDIAEALTPAQRQQIADLKDELHPEE